MAIEFAQETNGRVNRRILAFRKESRMDTIERQNALKEIHNRYRGAMSSVNDIWTCSTVFADGTALVLKGVGVLYDLAIFIVGSRPVVLRDEDVELLRDRKSLWHVVNRKAPPVDTFVHVHDVWALCGDGEYAAALERGWLETSGYRYELREKR